MTKFNTGNPVGSSDPRDLYDTASVADKLVQGEESAYADRLGKSRKSWAGIESAHQADQARRESEHDADQARRESEFQDDQDVRATQFAAFIAASGYEFVGDYAAGIEITGYQQVVRDLSGELWRVSGSIDLPYMTTGAGIPEGGALVSVGDAALRQDLVQPVATFNNVADMVARGGLGVGRKVRTLGYYAPGDGGGNDYEVVASSTGTDDGGSFIDLDNGLQAKGLFPGKRVAIEQFPSLRDGVTDDTLPVQAAIKTALSLGTRFVHIDSGEAYCAGDLVDRSNVIFVGDGKISGVYRRNVIPRNAPAMPPAFTDINPAQHLKRFAAATDPTVVMMGDSLSTFSANAIGRQETLAYLLIGKLKADNPDKNITIHNRAIGGQTWATADSFPTNLNYAWYTDDAKPWLDYIEELQPDLLTLSFGMNDAGSFDRTKFESVVAKINSWAKVPDIVFVTNLVPTLEPHPDYAGFGTKSAQEGRDYAAGYVRSFAKRNGYGVIDINRMCNIARDGRDILDNALKRVLTQQDVSATGGFEASESDECYDYSMSVLIRGSSAEIDDVFSSVNGTLSFRVGGDPKDVVFFKKDVPTGNISLKFYAANGYLYKTLNTGVSIPSSDFTLSVEKAGNTFSFRLQDSADLDDEARITDLLIHGGVLRPACGWYESNMSSGPISEVTLEAGQPRQYMPSILNDELWANGTPDALDHLPYGGNGINHLTSLGVSAIYKPALIATSFAAYSSALAVHDNEYPSGASYIGAQLPNGSEGGHSYIGNIASGALKFLVANQVTTTMTDTVFYPVITKTVRLGRENNRWGKAWLAELNVNNLPTYPDNAAAISGGLPVGEIYKTASGEVRVVVV